MNLKTFFFFFAVLLAFSACKNDSTDSSDRGDDVVTIDPESQNQPSKADLPLRMQHIVDYIWWYQGYVSSRQDYRLKQRGKWFQFYPNGTFDYGQFQEQTSTGTWRYDEKQEKLFLEFPVENINLEWKTMMSHTNELMVWMGPPDGINKGDQAKLERFLQRPREEDVAQ